MDAALRIAELAETHPDLLVCNCGGCGELLCSRSTPPRIRRVCGLRYVTSQRIKNRPVCSACQLAAIEQRWDEVA